MKKATDMNNFELACEIEYLERYAPGNPFMWGPTYNRLRELRNERDVRVHQSAEAGRKMMKKYFEQSR